MATNTTSTAANYTMKTAYEKQLLMQAKTQWVHAQFGKKYSIPANNGLIVEMRKSNPYTASTTNLLLSEGVTPTGQTYGQTRVLATVAQYGAYVTLSDLLDLTAFDPIIDENSMLLGEQLGTTLDWVVRDAMVSEASVQRVGSRTSMLAITTADLLSVDEVRKAVATLKKAKARPFSDGCFVMIVDPDVVWDLQNDADWQTPNTYSGTKQLYTAELGMLYGVRFVGSTEGKITYQSVLNAVNASTTTSDEFVLKNTPTAAEIAYLSTPGNKICIGANYAGLTEYTLHATTPLTESSGTYTVKLTTAPSLTGNHIVFSRDAGACNATTCAGTPIHHSLILGQEAFGVVDVAGKGGVEIIIKQKGSEGSADPLDQRSSIGAKVTAFTAKVLNSNWIIDVMSAATLSNP